MNKFIYFASLSSLCSQLICKTLKNFILNDANINKFYMHTFPNTCYNLDDILNGILYVLKTSICWRDSRSVVKWNSPLINE